MSQIKFFAEPDKQEVVMQCLFDAPRGLVFRTYNDAELIPRWWGPASQTTRVEIMDVRAGGHWRFVQVDPDGSENAFHGIYHEVLEPEKVVYTFEFEGMPGLVLMETITFEDCDGATLLTDHSVYRSVEDRDDMLKAGMETGSIESMQRLAGVLASF